MRDASSTSLILRCRFLQNGKQSGETFGRSCTFCFRLKTNILVFKTSYLRRLHALQADQIPDCLKDNLLTNMMTKNEHCCEKQQRAIERWQRGWGKGRGGGGVKHTSSSRSDLSLCRDGTKTPFPTGHFPQSKLACWHPAIPATAR